MHVDGWMGGCVCVCGGGVVGGAFAASSAKGFAKIEMLNRRYLSREHASVIINAQSCMRKIWILQILVCMYVRTCMN